MPNGRTSNSAAAVPIKPRAPSPIPLTCALCSSAKLVSRSMAVRSSVTEPKRGTRAAQSVAPVQRASEALSAASRAPRARIRDAEACRAASAADLGAGRNAQKKGW
eukprot:scaffold4768_cov105-Isochrysis_galbana.AAC.4